MKSKILLIIWVLSLSVIFSCKKSDNTNNNNNNTYTPGKITGKVTDKSTGNPIGGALIKTVPVTSIITTDADGNYSASVNGGIYQVTASKDGYVSITTSVTVNGNTATSDFQLDEPALSPGQAKIKGIIDTFDLSAYGGTCQSDGTNITLQTSFSFQTGSAYFKIYLANPTVGTIVLNGSSSSYALYSKTLYGYTRDYNSTNVSLTISSYNVSTKSIKGTLSGTLEGDGFSQQISNGEFRSVWQ